MDFFLDCISLLCTPSYRVAYDTVRLMGDAYGILAAEI